MKAVVTVGGLSIGPDRGTSLLSRDANRTREAESTRRSPSPANIREHSLSWAVRRAGTTVDAVVRHVPGAVEQLALAAGIASRPSDRDVRVMPVISAGVVYPRVAIRGLPPGITRRRAPVGDRHLSRHRRRRAVASPRGQVGDRDTAGRSLVPLRAGARPGRHRRAGLLGRALGPGGGILMAAPGPGCERPAPGTSRGEARPERGVRDLRRAQPDRPGPPAATTSGWK